jgi:hypothetical protein
METRIGEIEIAIAIIRIKNPANRNADNTEQEAETLHAREAGGDRFKRRKCSGGSNKKNSQEQTSHSGR